MVPQLIDAYMQRLEIYTQEIEVYCSSKRSDRPLSVPTTPSYLKEVIMPLFQAVENILPKGYGRLRVPNPDKYQPIKDKYRIRVGTCTVGGLLIPDGDSFEPHFRQFKPILRIEESIRIESVEQLSAIIIDYLRNK